MLREHHIKRFLNSTTNITILYLLNNFAPLQYEEGQADNFCNDVSENPIAYMASFH